MQFIIIHGSFGSPEENWFPWLKTKLEALGHTVLVPQFPVEDWDLVTAAGPTNPTKNQNLNHWLKAFSPLVDQIKAQPTIAIGHSLGPLFLLHTIQEFNLPYESMIFVAPFLSKLGCDWQIDLANETFYKTDFKFAVLRQSIPISYVIYSNNDPYVKPTFPLAFAANLDSQLIEVKGGGHFGTKAGYSQFPLVLELCKTRIPKS